MLRKIFIILMQDLKLSLRDNISVLMLFIPIVFAVAVNFFAPGIEDTTVGIGFIKGENAELADYVSDYAKTGQFDDYDSLAMRVMQRDMYIGIVGAGDSAYILTQGNEPQDAVEFTQLLKTFFEYDRGIEDSTAVIREFGVHTTPVKMLLANIGILFMTVLSGMMISLNIVNEKMDNTVSAMNVTPISRTGWIFGKSLIGILLSLIGSIVMLTIMGVAGNVNFPMLIIFVFISSLISIIIGFLNGLSSDDVMTSVAATKMIMLPLAISVAGYEFLETKWQWSLYWSPFYWIYKGNISILNGSMTWLGLLFTGGVVLGIAALVFALAAPHIRRGLER